MAWRTAIGARPDPIEGQLDILDELGRLRSATSVASLCSGYGGLELALEMWRPGAFDVQWHAEVDDSASLVLKTRHPEIPNLGDFTVPGFWDEASRAEWHVGGVPCQPFSSAGPQLGEADPRFLWPHWLEGIRVQRPATIVFENVEGLTWGKRRQIFDRIRAELVGLGYDVRWTVLGACAVGAAHHRHRVFMLARLGSGSDRFVEPPACNRAAVLLLPTPRAFDGQRGPVSESRTAASGRKNGRELATAINEAGPGFGKYAAAVERHAAVTGTPPPEPTELGPRGGRRLAAAFSEWLMMLPAGYVTDVLDRKAALGRLGNGVVPLQAATALRLLEEA